MSLTLFVNDAGFSAFALYVFIYTGILTYTAKLQPGNAAGKVLPAVTGDAADGNNYRCLTVDEPFAAAAQGKTNSLLCGIASFTKQ